MLRPVSLYCQHRRLDDSRVGPAALADLWLDADNGGSSSHVSAGNTLFTLIGFMGMYTVLSILFLFLVYREIEQGPGTWRGASWMSPHRWA